MLISLICATGVCFSENKIFHLSCSVPFLQILESYLKVGLDFLFYINTKQFEITEGKLKIIVIINR